MAEQNRRATEQKRLYRSRRNRLLGGVCGGIAEYFNVDPVLVRIIAIVIGLMTGPVGLVAYIVAWIIVPEPPLGKSPDKGDRSVIDTEYEVDSEKPDEKAHAREEGEAPEEAGTSSDEKRVKEPSGNPNGSLGSPSVKGQGDETSDDSLGTTGARNIFGYILVVIGGVMLLDRLAPWLGFTWSVRGAVRSFWPLLLVVIGVALVMSSRRGEQS
ncbi:MAG TPA: PspC domain-containing protein [Clostridia bacterium]|nr:PspC domain-containing protein [Clostridia bacterium]